MTQHIEEARKTYRKACNYPPETPIAADSPFILAIAAAIAAAEERGRSEERERCERVRHHQGADTMTRPTILDMDVVVVPREANATMWTEAAAPLERWRKETFFGSKNDAAVLSYRAAISASPYPTAWDDVRRYVNGLERSNEMWRRNSIDTKAAMAAMRNDINQHVPLPSLDSDLLQGPENSVFCATVASAVASRIAELEKRLADAERVIEPFARVKTADGYQDGSLRMPDEHPMLFNNAGSLDDSQRWEPVVTVGHLRAARAWMGGK